MKRLLFQTGGPWHPVDAQAALVRSWLPGDWKLETAFGNDALDRLRHGEGVRTVLVVDGDLAGDY